MKILFALLILIAVFKNVAFAEIIAMTNQGEWVKTTTKVKRKDLVDKKQKLREDKQVIKSSCEAQQASIQDEIDSVQSDIDTIDNWRAITVTNVTEESVQVSSKNTL